MRYIIFPLAFLLFTHSLIPTIEKPADKRNRAPATLFEHLHNWATSADLWRQITAGESLTGRIRLKVVKYKTIDAWVCDEATVCVSTQLLEKFSDAEQKAAIAHEIGHMVIPRNYVAPQHLWEVQCDVFAATLLRDADIVQKMLGTLGKHCRNCSDFQHPPTTDRIGFIEQMAPVTLATVATLDQLRGHNFAVQVRQPQTQLRTELKKLSFSIIFNSAEIEPKEKLGEMNFAVLFTGHTLSGQLQVERDEKKQGTP